MSSEFEAAGAAVTAGLVASVIDNDKSAGHLADGHAEARDACGNCGSALAGQFCATCGQPAHFHRTILHMGEEVLHGILHFDTRAWRTLPILVFRPGTLTHNYIHGKRARYISPIALFLLTVFTMFFVFALTGGSTTGGSVKDPATAVEQRESEVEKLRADLASAASRVNEAEAALAALNGMPADDPDRVQAAADVEEANDEAGGARLALEGAEAGLRAIQKASSSASVDGGGGLISIESTGLQDFYDQTAEAARNGDITINTGLRSIDKKVLATLQNPELAVYKIQNTAYKFSFLLIPISLPFMWLLFFWKRGVTLFDHSVFVLYSLSFMSLLFVVGALLGMWSGAVLEFYVSVMSIGVPVHMYFQLKGAYRLGWFSALWRTFFLLISCIVALCIFVVAIVLLGLTG